jgi:tRNA (mo5U34)-methyltransferase
MLTPTGTGIPCLTGDATRFQATLEKARAAVGPRDWTWYAYDSFGLFSVLDQMLAGSRRDLLALIGKRPVLDVGCADGALAFFFESLGLRVTAVDNSATNCNNMQGVRALREALSSGIEILDIDLDRSSLPPPAEPYGIALVLGILYHVRNPFHLLDEIARQARYCLLSTRVARVVPDRSVSLEALPVAYLVDSSELNADPTNYWIFSPAGLARLFQRTGWQVVDRLSAGTLTNSDPVRPEADERFYCLLRRADLASEFDAPGSIARLAYGWHPRGTDETRWRWTERLFGVVVDVSGNVPRSALVLQLYIPPAIIERFGAITLTAASNGTVLNTRTYSAPGPQTFELTLAGETQIDFSLDNALPPSAGDLRELGLIVSEIGLR